MRFFSLLICAAIACGDDGSSLQSGVPLPTFLTLDCNRDLGAAGARLRISGHSAACPLSIHREEGLVVGECAGISAGTVRKVVLEYYVLLDGELLVLAQQSGSIDLGDGESERVAVSITPALATRRCLGELSPAEINFSLCDNDGDGMENLAEYCHDTREPLIAERSGDP